MADSQERATFASIMRIKEENMDIELVDPSKDDIVVKEVSHFDEKCDPFLELYETELPAVK